MSSFCTAKTTHIFFLSKKFQHICVSLDVNFNESLTNDIVSFEQLGPGPLEFVIISANYNFFYFSRKQELANVKTCFLGKVRKTTVFCRLLHLPIEW